MSSSISSSPTTSFSATMNGQLQQPAKIQAQKQQVMDQAGLIAAHNELLLQAIIAKQLNQLAEQHFVEPIYLDHFSRAIDIKPGLKNLEGCSSPPPNKSH
jgi:hypothetical protein